MTGYILLIFRMNRVSTNTELSKGIEDFGKKIAEILI